MRCWKCSKRAIIYRRYEGRAWCKDCFSRQFEKNVKKTIRNSNLVEGGDRISVAVSGGKDSAVTLFILNSLVKKRPDVDLFAIGVDEGIPGYREKSLKVAKKFCKKLDVPLYIFSFKKIFKKTLTEIISGKNENFKAKACTYCGVLRRWIINKKSRELGANKVATGHNMDDELQSIFLDYLKGDLNKLMRLGAKPAIIKHPKFITRIKPLRNSPEREIAIYAMINNLDFYLGKCPYAGKGSTRFDVRYFINDMENKYPGMKYTALKMFDNILPSLRKDFASNAVLKECSSCGEITSQDKCKACKLLENC